MKPVFDTKTGSVYTRSVRKYSRVMIYTLSISAIAISIFSERAWSFEGYYGRLNDRIVDQTSEAAPQPVSHPSPVSGKSLSALTAPQFKEQNVGAADKCLPLLSSVRHTPPHNVMDRNQRSAGKAAALGLIFGVRFALTPSRHPAKDQKPEAAIGFWPTDAGSSPGKDQARDRSALAVVAYRQCQKQQALQALNGFRWSR